MYLYILIYFVSEIKNHLV